MNDSWFLLRSDPGGGAWNMALDEAIFEAASELSRPVLRFYSWNEPAATFGYSQHYAEIEKWTPLRPLIRRITGGGLVPHDADWTYSLIFPQNHPWYHLSADESYRRLHEWVAAAFMAVQVPAQLAPCRAREVPGQCFAGAEKFDVLAGGRKIAGAAQKRNKLGLLIQGSIQPGEQNISRAAWENAIMNEDSRSWNDLKLSSALLQKSHDLAEQKYGTPEHNRRR